MPSVIYPPLLSAASWERQSKALKKTRPITDLGDALKALAKRHDGIAFDNLDAGKSQLAADVDKRPALIDAEMKKVSATADAAKAVEQQARKLEAELKKDKQPPDAAVAVWKAAVSFASELSKLDAAASAAKNELVKRAAELKADGEKKPGGKDVDTPQRKQVRSRVVAGMRAVKTAQPTAKPIQFLICLGPSQCLAYLGHSVGASHRTLLTELMDEDSGFKFFKGECLWEAKSYTFVGSNLPSGLSKKLQKGLLELTKNRYKIRIRQDTGEVEEVDGDDVPDDADADVDADAAAFDREDEDEGDTAAADPAPLLQRLKLLTVQLHRDGVLDGPLAKDVKARIDAVSQALKSGDIDAAAKKLEAVEQIAKAVAAKKGAAASGAGTAAPATSPTPAAAPSAAPGKKRPSFVQLQKSRLAYDGLRIAVQGQLRDLEQSILAAVRAHNGDDTREDEFDEADVAASVKQVYALLDGLDARLIDKLDEALNAKEDERDSRHAEAANIIQEYQAFVAADPMLKEIDDNGFTKTTIRASVVKTLGELAAQF